MIRGAGVDDGDIQNMSAYPGLPWRVFLHSTIMTPNYSKHHQTFGAGARQIMEFI
jgi:hypothetical protein